jgi:hypothetical protein
MLNKTPIRWIFKRQKTVETSTYGSELVASRIATELILEVRYMLRSLGAALDGPALMLGDNMSVVLNTTFPSSDLKKKHNAISYHRVREAIAARIMSFVDFLDEVPSASHIKKDARALYGALLSSACQSGVGRRILMENRDKQDGICSWC